MTEEIRKPIVFSFCKPHMSRLQGTFTVMTREINAHKNNSVNESTWLASGRDRAHRTALRPEVEKGGGEKLKYTFGPSFPEISIKTTPDSFEFLAPPAG